MIRRNLLFLSIAFLVTSCSIFDDATSSRIETDNVENLDPQIKNSIDQVISGAGLLKDINQQVLSTITQHPSLGFGTDPQDDIQIRSNCPVISPEPGKLRIYPKEFEINLDSEGSGCQPAGANTKYKGKLFITVLAPVFLPGGHVIIRTENLSTGDNLDKQIENLTMDHKYKNQVDGNLVFDTQISRFNYSNQLRDADQPIRRRSNMTNVTGGITTYSDMLNDTDLSDLSTIIDDLVTIEFDNLELANDDEGTTQLQDGRLQYNIVCSCPIGGSFVDPSAGKISLRENSGCVDGIYTVRERNYKLECQ